jgi:hypothetical protein
MGLVLPKPAAFLDPHLVGRDGHFPTLGLVRADAFELAEIVTLKRTEPRPVHVVFPVKEAAEAANLEKLLVKLDPLAPQLIDGGWLAFGGEEDPGELVRLTQDHPWLHLFSARQFPPPDQPEHAWGKGSVMRALLYYLIHSGEVTDSRAIIQFLDADIVPAFFSSNWLLGPVGTVFWFQMVEAAKVVYFRPRGGRLNAFLRSLVTILPHAGIQRLQNLIYLLSGEMAATLKFWSSVPFKAGYGIEILVLLSLALDQVQLSPGGCDLEQVAQVFVGKMDHRHAPLKSTRHQRGLDQMAGNVFCTVFETLEQAGVLSWSQGRSAPPQLAIPTPGAGPAWHPEWLYVPVGEFTFPPLRSHPEIVAALRRSD